MTEQGEEQQGSNQSGSLDHGASIVDGLRASEIAGALPAGLVGLLLLTSMWWDGAFDLRYWAPLGVLSLTLLGVLVGMGEWSLPRRAPLRIAVVAIWCFAAFVCLSAAWSDSPGDAWEGAARTALIAAIFTLAVGGSERGFGARRLGPWLTGGVVVIAGIVLLRMLLDGADVFLAGRLSAPVGYRNGTAALFAFAAWPLIGIAARRGVSSGVRAAAFAATVLVFGLAFVTQSRGVLLGFLAGGLVSILIGPDPVRRSWLAIAALAAVAAVSGTLLSPFDAFDGGVGQVTDGDVRDAGIALLLLSAVAFAGGLFLFVLDNGLRRDLFVQMRARQLATIALLALAVVAGAGVLARVGNPVSYVDAKLDEFTNLNAVTTSSSGARLGTVSGQRYDLYRVAWDQFLEQPLVGGGEGSYRFAYYRDRRTDRNLNNPHSLPMRLLAETGLIGTGLFLAWLVAVGIAIARRARRLQGADRVWIAGLSAAAVTLLAQSIVDWLWLLPGLFGLGVLALGLASGGDDEEAPAGTHIHSRRITPRRVVATGALALATVAVALLMLSDLYVRKAREDALRSPQAELAAARTAAWLNPVAVTPLYLQASALESQGIARRPGGRWRKRSTWSRITSSRLACSVTSR